MLTQWIHPYKGDSYPRLGEISGIISLGGPMGANDEAEHPWIIKELSLLRDATVKEIPVLGVCLGAQLLARALGAKVEKNHTSEIGWYPIELNHAGLTDPVLSPAGKSPIVYQFHYDTFEIPKGAELLAHSRACAHQAFRVGKNAYGVQFHPEADRQLVYEWFSLSDFESEIRHAQKLHGTQSVQDPQVQLNHATQGEKSSLRITISACQLFRPETYSPVTRSAHSELETWATLRIPVGIEFNTADGVVFRLFGQIVQILALPAGEFVLLRGEDSILWPIRLDDIVRITPASK